MYDSRLVCHPHVLSNGRGWRGDFSTRSLDTQNIRVCRGEFKECSECAGLDWNSQIQIENFGSNRHSSGEIAHTGHRTRQDDKSNIRRERDENTRVEAGPQRDANGRAQEDVRTLAGRVRPGAQGPVKD